MPYFNSSEFIVANNKINLLTPSILGYYMLEVTFTRGNPFLSNVNGVVIANHFSYYFTDRYSDSRRLITNNIPSSVDGPINGKTFLNYNVGDRIQFQVKLNASNEWSYIVEDGYKYYNKFGLWRIAISNPSGRTDWPKDPWYYNANPSEPRRYWNKDSYFQHLYSWDPNLDVIENYQDYTNINAVAKYNDKFIFTLEGGYVYYFSPYYIWLCSPPPVESRTTLVKHLFKEGAA
jgi:hypothetical protein